jgi:hypothetical protein
MLQGLQGLGRIQFAATFAGAEAETVEQAKQIGITVTLVEAVVQGVSQGGAVPGAGFSGSLGPHHGKAF